MGTTHINLLLAAKRLRDAQRAYMADRGNNELGLAVAVAAQDLDEAIEASTALLRETSRGL